MQKHKWILCLFSVNKELHQVYEMKPQPLHLYNSTTSDAFTNEAIYVYTVMEGSKMEKKITERFV